MTALRPSPNAADARIYVGYHDLRPVLSGRHIVPIQLGRAVSGVLLPDVAGDDVGENISALNPAYCELTALYWIWKNDPSDGPVGLMHYRRLFDLGGRLPARSHPERYLAGFDAPGYLGDVEAYFERADPGDMVLPRPLHLRRSLERQYEVAHGSDDLQVLAEVVAERHPDFLPALARVLQGNRLLLGNMFILPRRVLDHYCPLLFDILQATTERLEDGPARSGYQARYPGFLAERILTAYVLGGHAQAAFPALRILHRGIMNIDTEVVSRANWLNLGRLMLQSRIGLGEGVRLKLQTLRG